MCINELKSKLKVGAKIRIGRRYNANHYGRFKDGEIIELIDGWFEHDNGLYCESRHAPSILSDDDIDEFDSIYHLFGNNFEEWDDCEVIDED